MSRRALVLVVILLFAAVLIACWHAASGTALTNTSPSPSPSETATVTASPSPTATPTPPASSATVKKALKVRAKAVKAWKTWNRARACLSMKHKPFASPKPPRSASERTWQKAKVTWAKKLDDLKARKGRLLDKMRSPGGSSNGKRWMPLARWVGWPKYALGTLSKLIMNESSGIQRRISSTGDYGLTQINRKSWAATFVRVMKKPFVKYSRIAEYNLRFALYIWKVVQHCSFLTAWRGDAAATW